ncbi:Pkinase-domain-containing protein [Sodiomyces alkalinus F11]|uniref:non-specific serine/threonine protein kinase n=1 Tax=Sodiomyces alkalinus (strain CBS 110278 / VKM F-3762 / F11) TaxID=1314773 RepID=A0A3N2PSQ1_SODAK|nr:Pkinase-domain-containing protein [Sodiomyces alkalinus F11]ROT37535.1 Pkinase-domain-containing protein [Sodiomyces alkalinus F11]
MAEPGPARSSLSRPPLVDAGHRINNNVAHATHAAGKSHKLQGAECSAVRTETIDAQGQGQNDGGSGVARSHGPSEPRAHPRSVDAAAASLDPAEPCHPRARAVREADPSKRVSQASQNSAAPSSNRSSGCNYKTQIGPWQLGKTLGKGSSARVRLCRHRISGELAAVKIVPKKAAYLIQHGSLAALHQYDDSLPDRINGEMRVPLSIEREVAILKLIDHPNVMKVYDIWENRSEIYLVLEYVDKGDLFDYINTYGRLNEDAAMFFFRQIMSAMQYCHTFNICHRDLKPENILLTSKNRIKIADFGMAALHQSEGHRLETACGSPHYAAPELLKNKQYRGDKADIWSMGVILYAMLAASLPFDDPDIRILLSKSKRGLFEIPEFLGLEAKDLIRRMLQTDPATRITLKEMWHHPLVQKYDHLDDLGNNGGQPPDIREGFDYNPLRPQEVDPHLVRQLRSLWHMYTEHQIKLLLMDSSKNDQKLFYWLLHNYREKQLENFLPELAQSPSDYHHLHEPAWKKRVSTCEFSQPRAHGLGRSISRFTVISNVPDDTDTNTVKSYDPYNSDRPMRHNSQASHAKIIIHRKNQASRGSERVQLSRAGTRSSGQGQHGRMSSQRSTATGRLQSPVNSMSSLHSRQGAQFTRPAPRRKRGIDFTHVRQQSTDQRRSQNTRQKPDSAAGDGWNEHPHPHPHPHPHRRRPDRTAACPGSPSMRKGPTGKDGPMLKIVKPRDPHAIVNEEVRNFSNSIAKDCDEAFNGSMIESDISELAISEMGGGERDSSPFSFNMGTPSIAFPPPAPSSCHPWDTRPLPPLPAERPASPEPASPQLENQQHDHHKEGVSKVFHHVNRLALPVLLPKQERRVVSAPAYAHIGKGTTRLPSIGENGQAVARPLYQEEVDRARIVSAPPPRTPGGQADAAGLDYLSRVRDTIRVVDSPSATNPVPKPLNVRKKYPGHPTARRFSTDASQAYYMHGASSDGCSYTTSVPPSQQETAKKKSSWFKRSSKDSERRTSGFQSEGTRDSQDTRHSPSTLSMATHSTADDDHNSDIAAPPIPIPAKKKNSFGFLFWKNSKMEDPHMSIAGPDYEDSPSPESVRAASGRDKWQSQRSLSSSESGTRNIEVHRNWLARLFGVKPAKSHMCLVVSRKRAQQEIVMVLKDWRRYGIRDVQVDKERNIVFARVGPKNYLDIKEVSFAIEIMTVIEHGKRGPLSIVRFTQERGAASSFHKVVDTLKTVFASRNLVVTDKRKAKMMVKTLNS